MSKSTFIDNAENFAIISHGNTNHYYDEYLPYEFHLRMVVKAAKDFIKLVPKDLRDNVIAACWLHDAIEDVRLTYNDVKAQTKELDTDARASLFSN